MTQGPKLINVHGHKVPESQLKESLKDVLGKRGLSAHLLVEREMTEAERKASLGDDPPPYYNVYKYAFFS